MHKTNSRIEIRATRAKVWAALTAPELVRQWQYGAALTTTWELGSRISFRSEWQGQVYEQWGTVIEYRPEQYLKYSLFAPRPGIADVPENYFEMIYTLEDQDGCTRVTITQNDPRPNAESSNETQPEEENPVLVALRSVVESS